MASGSSKAKRPAWQKTLLAVPEQERSPSQNFLIQTFDNLEVATNILSDPYVFNALDFKAPNVLKALAILHSAAVLGDFARLEYYLTPKMQAMLYNALAMFINEHGGLTDDQNSPGPDVLVTLALATAIFTRMRLYKSYNTEIPETESAKISVYSEKKKLHCVSWKLTGMLERPSVMRKCDTYLRKKLGQLVPFELGTTILLLSLNIFSIVCSTCLELTPNHSLNMSNYTMMLLDLKAMTAQHSKSLGRVPVDISITIRRHLEPLDFQIKRMSECHAYLVRSASTPIARSDPLEMQWRETSDFYLKFLKDTIERAKQGIEVDLFNVALLHRQLLTAMLSGVAKCVTYAEIESVCNDLKSAADACATWAPPLWKLEIETDCKIVYADILPFLREVNPSSYKTASVNTLTPGFLDLYTPSAVYDRLYGKRVKKCDACGVKSIDLFKCKGVRYIII